MNIHSQGGFLVSKTVLITGATAGIGRYLALDLARRGYRVFATGRREAELAKLRAEVPSIETLRMDVTSAASVDEGRARIEALTNGHGLDVLINNAGYGVGGAIEEVTDEDLRAQFDTNVFGLMTVTRAFLPKMRARGAGRIVNVGSIAGRLTFPMFGAYHASKHAVEALSDALRCELAPFGIQVSLIEPGPIHTEFGERASTQLEKYRANAESPYANVYARAEEIKLRAAENAVGPEAVGKVVLRAIEARRPAARYVVPFSARVFVALAEWMPTRLFDWAMRQFIGLTPKQLARPTTRRVEARTPALA
jgi:NAD(P)-dependent dehydrogenase (short-subunit alcohol dehydrogenase family)